MRMKTISRRSFVGLVGAMATGTVLGGIALRGDEVSSSLGKIDAWYAGLGI